MVERGTGGPECARGQVVVCSGDGKEADQSCLWCVIEKPIIRCYFSDLGQTEAAGGLSGDDNAPSRHEAVGEEKGEIS